MTRIALALAVALASLPATASRLQLAGCPRDAAEYRGEYSGRVILARAFLDERKEAEQIREGILQQLKYLWGWLRTSSGDGNTKANAPLAVLSAATPEIAIDRRTVGKYGRDLVLDWSDTSERLRIDDPYTKRAVARGAVHAGDEALIVEYTLRFGIALCGPPRDAASTAIIPLPDDPWLFFWHVPAAARRKMDYYGRSAVTTPCSDDDFANLPHPFYYWYDWWPTRHGRDAEGRDYDCRALLRDGKDYFPRTVKLTRLAAPAPDFSSLRAHLGEGGTKLSATVLIGVLDHAWKDLAPQKLADELGRGAALPARAASALEAPRERERAAKLYLHLLADLGAVIDRPRHRSAVEAGYLAVTVEGTLKRSGRPIELHLFYGPTDVFGYTPPAHWSILRRALGSDQVIVYAGHSGIGENFRLAQIEKRLSLDPARFADELGRVPYQLVAFLSCYSYMYFGEDLIAARGPERGRQFVYTGTEFSRGDRGALAVIDLVDQAIAGQSPSLRFVSPDDFFLIKEFR